MRGSSAGMAPRRPGSSSAASRAGSSGERCQCPSGCSAWAEVSAVMWSARAIQSAAWPGAGWAAAMARSPLAAVSRLWVQARGFDFPDPGVGFGPPVCDRGGGGFGCVPVFGVEAVGAGGGGEQVQGFAEGVELELVVDPVADEVESAGVAGEPEVVLVGDRGAGGGVGGGHRVAVFEQPVGDEADGGVQQRVGAGGGDRDSGVALVADPDVAVVVVAAGFGPFGQAGGGGGDHAATATGQPSQHRVAAAGVARRQTRRPARARRWPRRLRWRASTARRRPVQRATAGR